MTAILRGTALCGLILAAAATPAWAQRGGGGGGAGSGGAPGGGSGGNVPSKVKTILIPLVGSSAFPGATGTAYVSFNSSGSYRALDVEVQDVDLPDGAFLEVVFLDDADTATIGSYYTLQTVCVPQAAGGMMVKAGAGSLVLANGSPSVPLFGRNGMVMVSVVDAFGNVVQVLSASYTNLGQAVGQTFNP